STTKSGKPTPSRKRHKEPSTISGEAHTYLDQQRGHPALIEQMRRDRANLARIRRELTTADDPDDLYDDDLDQENEHA
ncbi:hypothetical protein, partial [Mycolicibacterium brumae]